MIKRIAITGPESTGKTSLTRQLADHYHAVWVPEFARDYLTGLSRQYTYDDILYIARNQFRLNSEARSETSDFVFCDTELIVTCIWCKVKYGKCHSWITEHIRQQEFSLILLTDIDLQWEPDPLREHPGMREYLMQLYIEELEERDLPFRIVNGSHEQRVQNAIKIIEEVL